MDSQEQQTKALEMIRAVYQDGIATINGRDYEFTKTNHKTRRKVFAFYTRIAQLVRKGDFQFLDWPEWDNIEKLICDITLYDGMAINKRKDHWDEFSDDYLQFISTALPVISYPFLKGSLGD